MWLNATNASNYTVNLARYQWDKTTTNAPTFISSTVIQNLGVTTVPALYSVYYSIRVYNLNNIEIFSSFNVSNNATLFVTDDNFVTSRSLTLTDFLVGVLQIAPADVDTNNFVGGSAYNTVFPAHLMITGDTTNQSTSSITSFRLVTVSQPSQTVTEYLSMDYDRTNSLSQITGASSTKLTTWSSATSRLGAAGSSTSPTYYYQSDSTTGNTIQGNTSITGGNLTVDTDTLFVDATNNRVGLGTTSPSYMLDVSGTLNTSGATTLLSTLAVTGATTLIGGLIQPLMAGYLLDGNTTNKGPYTYSPILCSQYSMNATAEALVTFPGYKIVLYQNTNYTGTSVPYDNFSGTTTICSTLTPNFYSSCKVYYRSDSNEVTIANIS
jgi:hypothetical protein